MCKSKTRTFVMEKAYYLVQSRAFHVYNIKPLVILLVLLLLQTHEQLVSATTASTVQYLPGFDGPLPFHLETGYVGVDESENVQLFYYFVKSERNPEKDPLLIWLTGGPACSSWSGFVHEIGPVWYKIEEYNGTLPSLVLNQHSWTKASSVIFIDSPVGAGFSYKKTPSETENGDLSQVENLFQFFKKWLNNLHPEFMSNPIYIAGDSYSGIPIPVFFQKLSNGIEEGIFPPVNLQGYILGNPVTDMSSDSNFNVQYAHGMALISDELYESLKEHCGGKYYERIDPSNTECLKHFQAYEKCISDIKGSQVLEINCGSDFVMPKRLTSGRRWLNQNPQMLDQVHSDSEIRYPFFGCREYEFLLAGYWANDPRVREALHVEKDTIREWRRCNFDIPYNFEVPSSVPYHANLSSKGYRSLIYSGDHDMVVTYMGTQAWIRSLNYSIVEDWRSWIVKDQVAGYTRTYSNRMTFATVKGGGHTAVEYKPEECFALFQRWIDYQSL